MSGHFRHYPRYAATGQEWIKELPVGWQIFEGKRLFTNRREASRTDDEQLAASQQYGVVPQKMMMSLNDSKVMLALKGTSTFRHVEVGDFVISLRSFEGGIEYSAYTGCVSPAYTVLAARIPISGKYYRYLLKCDPFVAALQSTTDSLRDGKAISFSQFGSIRLPAPPLDEQTQIAKFLDYETAKIDALVAKQQQLIALLQEKRQAVISHAVTTGLNPAAPLRDSGVEWLGEVPAHWTVTKVRNRYEVQLGKMLKQSQITGESLYPYLSVFDVQWGQINVSDLSQMDFDIREQEKYRLQPGDLIVNEGGSYVGRSAIWQGELENCFYQKALHRMRPLSKEDTTRFLYYVMMFATKKGVFVAGGNQTTIDHLTASQLNNYKFPFPPIAEQIQIASHLDDINLKFERLISKAEAAVELLQERRTALIAAAVTGKIDVRVWQPPCANAEGATP